MPLELGRKLSLAQLKRLLRHGCGRQALHWQD